MNDERMRELVILAAAVVVLVVAVQWFRLWPPFLPGRVIRPSTALPAVPYP